MSIGWITELLNCAFDEYPGGEQRSALSFGLVTIQKSKHLFNI